MTPPHCSSSLRTHVDRTISSTYDGLFAVLDLLLVTDPRCTDRVAELSDLLAARLRSLGGDPTQVPAAVGWRRR